MKHQRVGLLCLGFASATLFAACASDSSPPQLSQGRAVVYRAPAGQPLTVGSRGAPQDVVAEFLAARGSATSTLRPVAESYAVRDGLLHLRFAQEIDGVRVVGRYVRATVNDRGELVHAVENLAVPTGRVDAATIDERQAMAIAARHHGYATPGFRTEKARQGNMTFFSRGETFYDDPRVERVLFVDQDGELHQGFEVETWSLAGNLLHHTVVDGAGRIVFVELRTNTDAYNVYVEDPGKGEQTVVQGPGAGNAESPAGWLGSGAQNTINISGNNVNAYLDARADNRADRGGTAVANGQFLTAADLTAQPSTAGNREVAVQNLFYLNNVIHDVLYRHGFDEAAGNFQASNFGQGGAAGDPVKAEAQDGGGTDNANFATPADGSSPRMQMYLWSSSLPDHDLIVHTPAGIAGTYDARGAEFGPALTATGFRGDVVLVNDGAGTTSDACEAVSSAVSGKVALVDRGGCEFQLKVANAQAAGAKAVIVANNQGGDATMVMGGTNRRIKIPSVFVSQNTGTLLRGSAGVNATMRKDPTPLLMVDGDLDADIVFHEYGHGLSWRMIGGMSGPMAGAIGEGASDVVAFLVNGDDRIGEYAAGNPAGIRRYPYAGYPLTYSAVTGGEVHDDGEVYAAILWRVRELFLANGLTSEDVLDVFVRGMAFTPSTPAFEDMRDGMLAAAGSPLVECLIWDAFAQFGVGVGASGTTSAPITIVESFTKPAICQ